jgi:hypothetical protein
MTRVGSQGRTEESNAPRLHSIQNKPQSEMLVFLTRKSISLLL